MADLKQAISYIYDIEKNNYLLTRAIQQVDKEMRYKFEEPKIRFDRKEKYPEKPKLNKDENKDLFDKIFFFLFFGGIGFVGGVIVFAIIIGVGTLLILRDGHALSDSAPFIAVFGGIIGMVAFPIYEKKAQNNDDKKKEMEYQQQLSRYNAEQQEFYEKQRTATENARKEFDQRYKALQAIKGRLRNQLKVSMNNVAEFYNIVGIDPKFRNLVPIAYMNEFLNLGIATKLEGADGLYYLTMRELKSDEMNRKLDVISYKLDSVINQQHSLYGELCMMNQKCDEIIYQTISHTEALVRNNNLMKDHNKLMEQIESNTALAAYNSERTAREQEYMGYMARYSRW